MATYDYWRAALAGQKPKAFTDDPQPGFYRDRITEKTSGGATRTIGYVPVAIWEADGAMVGLHRGANIAGDALNHLWNHVCANPISEETFRKVSAGEPWPGEHAPRTKDERERAATPAGAQGLMANPPTGPAHGLIPGRIAAGDGELVPDPAAAIIAEIASLKDGVADYQKIETDEQATRGQDLRSKLTAAAGKLDRHREALVRPHVDAQREINGQLNPIINATKGLAETIRVALKNHEREKREAAEAAQARAEEANREAAKAHDAAVADAMVEGAPLPDKPAPVAPTSNAEAPAAKIKGATGRAAHVKDIWVAVIDDPVAFFASVKYDGILMARLQSLAQATVNAGIDAPGVSKKRDVDVR